MSAPPIRGGTVARQQRWLITGRVQGVGYRMWLVAEARALGVMGWVRNLEDGRVEAMVSGPAGLLERLAEAARSGPRLAVVSGVEIAEWEGKVSGAGFAQRETAAVPAADEEAVAGPGSP